MSEALLTGENLSLSEALSMGGETTVIGLCIVFSVLIILMIVLYLFRVIFYKDPKKQAAKNPVPVEPTPAPIAEESSADMDEEELIAVLTAAVAASLNTSTYNLQIKSYRRVGSTSPAWNRAGLNETIANRF